MVDLENPNASFEKKPPELADSSASLFNNYSRIAEKDHKKTAKRWQKDADGILVFTGLFSVSIAALLTVTVPHLTSDPQEKTAFYLENIYELLADGNLSRSSISIPPLKPPHFSPPRYVVVVNTLWFLSLTIGLTSAMLAIMLQQWARRYLQIAQNLGQTPHDVARIRAFFSRGVDKLYFSSVSDTMTLLIHTSLFLFLTGLLIYLFNINRTVFDFVIGWIAFSVVAYLLMTIMPLLLVDSPYYSPFSLLAFKPCGGILYLVACSKRLRVLAVKYLAGFSKGIKKMAGDEITKRSSEVDTFILKWTLDAHILASDRQLDQFINDICGFYSSKIIPDPESILAKLDPMKFTSVSMAFMKRTFSLTSLSDRANMERFKTYLKVANLQNCLALLDIFSQAEYRDVLRTIDVGQSLGESRTMGLLAQTIVADILAAVPVDTENEGNRWVKLAAKQLSLSESEQDIRTNYSQNRDNMLLANWILIAPQISNSTSDSWAVAEYILPSLSGFNIQNTTLPGLQRKFCVNWNEILEKAAEPRNGNGSAPHFILSLVRDCYIALHSPDTFRRLHIEEYPKCPDPHAPHRTALPPPLLRDTDPPSLENPSPLPLDP